VAFRAVMYRRRRASVRPLRPIVVVVAVSERGAAHQIPGTSAEAGLRGTAPSPATYYGLTRYGQATGLTANVVADPTGVMKTTLTFATVVPVFWALPTAPG
jgi:hypothetical protein